MIDKAVLHGNKKDKYYIIEMKTKFTFILNKFVTVPWNI